jgi:hypothetical protein
MRGQTAWKGRVREEKLEEKQRTDEVVSRSSFHFDSVVDPPEPLLHSLRTTKTAHSFTVRSPTFPPLRTLRSFRPASILLAQSSSSSWSGTA